MAAIKTSEKVLWLGGYRQGKTTAAKSLMRRHLAAGGVALLIDPAWEMADMGLPVVHAVKDIAQHLQQRKSVVFQPNGGGTREDIDAAIGEANRFPNLIVLIDECHLFVQYHTSAHDIPNFNHLIRLGHKWGRGMWCISHRLSDFPGSARNVHHVFHFPTFVSQDVEAARLLFGDLADQLKTLPKYSFLYWGPEAGAMVCKPLNITGSATDSAEA